MCNYMATMKASFVEIRILKQTQCALCPYQQFYGVLQTKKKAYHGYLQTVGILAFL